MFMHAPFIMKQPKIIIIIIACRIQQQPIAIILLMINADMYVICNVS